MKNEIGRKLTSLTIMAIMFAGGMAIGVTSFMPVAAADFSVTDGQLSVSSEFIQGGAVLEIVVNDPAISSTIDDINSGAEVVIGGASYDMAQGVNGKWYLYVVDNSIATDLDDDATGFEYGYKCDTGVGVSENTSNLIIPSGTVVFVGAISGAGKTIQAGGCFDVDNAVGVSDDTSGTTNREDILASVLQDPPTLSNHNEKDAGDGDIDLGQRGHGLNESGYGSWPYILAIELNDDNIIEYNDYEVNVEFGNTDDESSIELTNRNPAAFHDVHLTITDPALNIDPTTADVWIFDVDAGTGTSGTPIFANNGSTNTAITLTQLGAMQCEDNCRLHNSSGTIKNVVNGTGDVTMTESTENSGIFESFDLNGDSEMTVLAEAVGDTKIVFTYADNDVDMIITYHDASIDFENPNAGNWQPATSATVLINDPDMNFNPLEQDELEVGDERRVIPTIKMGTPKT